MLFRSNFVFSHGAPLGKDEVALVKKNFGVDPEKHFEIYDDVYTDFGTIAQRGKSARLSWESMFEKYCEEYPELGDLYKKMKNLEISGHVEEFLPVFETGAKIATRSANGKVLGAMARNVPWLIGGDADLSCSTKTAIGSEKWISADDFSGRNIHFGVREHAMGAIANGISYYGFFKPFTATFFSFVDYMRPALRLASLSKLETVFVFTHDSLAVGEDGPTHQPVEQLASIRCIPGLTTIRPADANETSVAWKYILENRNTPVALILTRQDIPVLDRLIYAPAAEALKGGYIISDCEDPEIVIIATGSEVHIALEAGCNYNNFGIFTI